MKAQDKTVKKSKSVVFSWDQKDFNALLKSCDFDDGVCVTLKYLKNKNIKILEAGCGIGRVIKYLYDKGYHNISGIEINKDIVLWLNKTYPELPIIHADLLNMPFEKNSFDAVLSYGVIEHFPQGPQKPLKAMFDILKPGGICIITVPAFNILRRIHDVIRKGNPKENNFVRRLFGKKQLKINKKRFGYYVDPKFGDFFEYRFTRKQIETICRKANFQIIESSPISHIDGLFHSLFRSLVTFENWEFRVKPIGKLINTVFKKIPSFHNHMHLCVVKKLV